jgi:arylsulfatase A-like enzyme
MSVQAMGYFARGQRPAARLRRDRHSAASRPRAPSRRWRTACGDKEITDAALKHARSKPENTDKRFFLWVHYVDPHADYLKPRGHPEFGSGARDSYDGEVAFVDKQVGAPLRRDRARPRGASAPPSC